MRVNVPALVAGDVLYAKMLAFLMPSFEYSAFISSIVLSSGSG